MKPDEWTIKQGDLLKGNVNIFCPFNPRELPIHCGMWCALFHVIGADGDSADVEQCCSASVNVLECKVVGE